MFDIMKHRYSIVSDHIISHVPSERVTEGEVGPVKLV